jgi:hypothetical protein
MNNLNNVLIKFLDELNYHVRNEIELIQLK